MGVVTGNMRPFVNKEFHMIDDFPAAKDSGKVLIIIIYCYLIIISGPYV